jgi:uncharacterized protein
MKVVFDEAKRQKTLRERGLDFADAGKIFEGTVVELEDDRFDYLERRVRTYGLIDNRLVMIAWTPIENGIRVISMRKCNEREQKAFTARLG